MTNIAPVEDKILVRLPPAAETVEGGIIVPATSQPLITHALVLAHGPGRYIDATGERAPLPCKVGDYILTHRNVGDVLGDTELRLLNPRDVLAVVSAPELVQAIDEAASE